MNSPTAQTELDIPIGDRLLRVFRSGDGGTDIVFEAGGGRPAADWQEVQHRLPEEVTSWSYDRAGEGASPADGDWTLEKSVADLGAWLVAVGARRPAVFVGHSLGCHIIRAFVAANPDTASAMVLVDPRPPGFEYRVLKEGIPIATPPPEMSIVREITHADETVSALSVPDGVKTVVLSCEWFDGAPGELTGAETDRIAIMWRQAQDDLARSIGQGPAVVVTGTGHGIAAEAPDVVASVIRGCLWTAGREAL